MTLPHSRRVRHRRAGRRWLATAAGVAFSLGALLPVASASAVGTPPAYRSDSPNGSRSAAVSMHANSPGRDQIWRTTSATAGSVHRGNTQLERTTGLVISMDKIKPAALAPRKDLVIKGTVTNGGAKTWRDAQVYLDIESQPATTRAALDAFRAVTGTSARASLLSAASTRSAGSSQAR